MRLILASTSPRRKEILGLLGTPFEVIAPDFTETLTHGRAIEQEVLDFAVGKAQSVASRQPESIVVGSDTMIAIDGQKIGKPAGFVDARRILRELSGKEHRILTSVAIVDGQGGPGLTLVEEVRVKMHPYPAAEVDAYLACNESFDKAGAYSIQGHGRALIERIEGDYLAAVGLPLRPIADYLSQRGVVISRDIASLYRDRSFLNWATFE
ncbi:MAG: septum formation protein Maf [Deltaproteobacteria bacterium]|nr:septum formation protein Maf [Deltaproteobacteria bacterium]